MAKLSPVRKNWPLLKGLELLNRGKVRDTYDVGNDLLLIIVTDAISIFDHVLNGLVPLKGQILNAMSHYWLTLLENDYGIKTHLVAAGAEIDQYLPEELRGDSDLQSRAMVVKKLKMADIEFIARAHLTGSGLRAYKKDQSICGHLLPPGMSDGSELPVFLDTPTTKADEGHDEHVSAEGVRKSYPEESFLLMRIFQIAYAVARRKGIILPDTKFEFGKDNEGNVILADEALTPDSSRFWLKTEWRKAVEKDSSPASFDKELVRTWGKTLGINELDPENPDDVQKVHGMRVPAHITQETTQAYRYIFWRLTGYTLEDYMARFMGVYLPWSEKKVAVILGSKSDIPAVIDIIKRWKASSEAGQIYELVVHVISCHRNPKILRQWTENPGKTYDAIIAVGGKAFAMPGVLDAWLYHYHEGAAPSVIGVALGKPGSKALQAAVLSIEEIPGQPVIMDEINGEIYSESSGFETALRRVDLGELPPKKKRVKKPAEFDIAL